MKSKTMDEHRKKAPIHVSCGVITLSDTKSKEKKEGKSTDKSGEYIVNSLKEKYQVDSYILIPDDKERLLKAIESMINQNIDIIITTGGTGIGSRDITIETIEPLFQKQLSGFGEIFRSLSYKDLGSGAILSRATGGVYKNTLIFAMPGSPNAVKLGISIIIDELSHLKKHLKE